jgi:hypothetical protein
MVMPFVLTLVLQAQQFQSPSCVEGQGWNYVIRERDLGKTPRWGEPQDAPPLPPRAAIRSAREFLRRMTCQGVDQWEVHQVALQPIAGTLDVWVYLVKFVEPSRVPKRGSAGSFFPRAVDVVVLLDGTAVAPSVGPWPPRR